jgi:hypothetical protein
MVSYLVLETRFDVSIYCSNARPGADSRTGHTLGHFGGNEGSTQFANVNHVEPAQDTTGLESCIPGFRP